MSTNTGTKFNGETQIYYDVLIIGAGPAGVGAATFLAHLGVTRVLMMSKANGTADTPRAHVTNAGTMEYRQGTLPRERMVGTARRMENYHTMSPSKHLEIPQTYVEPILLKEATKHGITARFDTEFLTLAEDADGVTTQLRDCLTGATYSVRSKFVICADGGQSAVMKHLGIPMHIASTGALAINVLFKCDLTEFSHTRRSLIIHTFLAEMPGPAWGLFGAFRPIKLLKEWLGVLVSSPQGEKERPTPEIIQDSYNLAWKIAYVLQGKAGLGLLDTYSVERQPIRVGIIKRANDGFRTYGKLRAALGFHEPGLSPEEAAVQARAAAVELKEASERGKERKSMWRDALESGDKVLNAFGIEMNHLYNSTAVWLADEVEEPVRPKDLLMEHIPSTYPAFDVLIQFWVLAGMAEHAHPDPRPHFHAGKGAFALFTGIGGDAWHLAAQAVAQRLGIDINVFSIGYGQEHTDLYDEWVERRGVEDDGAVLVRPDRSFAWRLNVSPGIGAEAKLEEVLRRVLSL
ncbi:FAD binding domain-containing protein [Pterulicium gracile]|uniref:FAD binding domain-containing protein n=1 Tax=Pterulicium gracile TaxID=1884261 RepID=A0A5C3QP12_9AGAR|nr:FAD binding domain-containing protein [Pterula gracilis]